MILNLNTTSEFNNPFVKEVQQLAKDNKLTLVERIISLSREGDIITAGIVEKLKVTPPAPKVEKVTFYDYFVKVGNRLYQIQVEETGNVETIFGITVKTNVKKSEFIIRDEKVYYIKTDKFGTKYLSE